MSKKNDVRSRIKKVMADLAIDNQAAFAKALGFRPTTLSAWMTSASLPSPDAYMVLGRKAPSIEDSLFFWEKAGLTRDAILSAAAKIEREQGRDAASEIAAGDAVSIAPLTEFNTDGSMSDLVLPRQYVPNAASVRYLAVNKGFAFGMKWKPYLKDLRAARIEGMSKDTVEMMRQIAIEMANSQESIPPFEIGDILLVDISNSDTIDLAPFWGETILFATGLQPQAYIIGQLGLQPRHGLAFEARLYYWTTAEGGETYDVASWRSEMLAGAPDQDDFPDAVEDEAEARARKELRLTNAQRILGIVTGWLSIGSQR